VRRPDGDGRCQRPEILGRDEKAQLTRSVQLAPRDERVGRTAPAALAEPRAEMLEIVEPLEQKPWTKSVFLADECAACGKSAPYERAAILVGPYGDDSGSRVPSPQPFVFRSAHEVDSSGPRL